MNADNERVDFDLYASRYEALLKAQQSLFGGERSYFSQYKIDLLRRLFPGPVGSILDFGAGIGLSLPFVLKNFFDAKIHATDISTQSLAHIAKNFPQVIVVSEEAALTMRFELIFVITVLHHVEPQLRAELMRRLGTMLASGGSLCIFEHNPYNPITQRMVSTCEFDTDAILLPRRESIGLIEKCAGLELTHTAYTLFLPHTLRALRPLERYLGWLPLGGQYLVIGRKR